MSSEESNANSPGLELLLDVFRRADKNDDSKISLEEFENYFDDGILDGKQLAELFAEIDTDGSGNIDHRELCKWFEQGFGAHAGLFDALAAASSGMTRSLGSSAASYDSDSVLEQYRTRFLLREALLQVEALAKPLEHAVDSLEDRSRRAAQAKFQAASQGSSSSAVSPNFAGSSSGPAPGAAAPPPGVRIPNPSSSFTFRTGPPPASPALAQSAGFDGPSSSGGGYGAPAVGGQVAALAEQVDRLRKYVDNYVSRLEFVPVEEGSLDDEDEAVIVVMRTFDVNDADVPKFIKMASTYFVDARAADGCLHLYMKQEHSDASTVMFWEVWESTDHITDHYLSDTWRTFLKASADVLISPTVTKDLPLPASWWPAVQ